ncbi:MAG: 50S ribosome-binding GTPase [Thermoguttaceae bacterium]|nr:50S ribosome-binding GTPase [Thermoguttaceae bacterium]
MKNDNSANDTQSDWLGKANDLTGNVLETLSDFKGKIMDTAGGMKDKALDLFNEKYGEVVEAMKGKRPNILVCGYTGSGKTSLVRAVLGSIVEESRIGNGLPVTMGYDKYENDQIVIWDSKGMEPGVAEETFMKETRRFVRQCQEDTDLDKHIHLVWYTIQGSGARVSACDIKLINTIFNPKDVIVVVTKKDITRPSQFEAIINVLTEAGVAREHILAVCSGEGEDVPPEGTKELVELSCQMLPEAYRDAFMAAQQADLEAKIDQVYKKGTMANTIIKTASVAAAGIGVIPIPLSDATLLLPTQMGMIASLAMVYGMEKKMVASLALPFVGQCAGIITATSLTKLIPMVGSAINATVAGGITWAMGMFVKNNFEEIAVKLIKGEEVPALSFSFDKFKKFYEDYKNGASNPPDDQENGSSATGE